jgi:phosphate transport system permease protein
MSALEGAVLSPRRRGRRSPVRSWRRRDQLVYVLAWVCGLALCLLAGAIVVYMAVRGLQYLTPSLIFSHPQAGTDQSTSGGFLDPLLGTLLVTAIATAVATPIAVATALWIVEYGRPRWLVRVIESSIEIVAGTPDIVIAIFGLAIFQLPLFSFLSFTASGGGVFGRSFLAAGIMLSLLALPPVFTATREGLLSLPSHLREASYALGKTRIATIRRVVAPAVRKDIATGMTLGISRIIGDTAIVIVLLGATLRIQTTGGVPGLGLLRGSGSTLTSYVYENSPAGDGGAPQKAYAAAFVLLVLVVALNWMVDLIARRGSHAQTATVGGTL